MILEPQTSVRGFSLVVGGAALDWSKLIRLCKENISKIYLRP